MDRFENRIIKGIHISRYIASWINAGGESSDRDFEDWLRTVRTGYFCDGEPLTEDEIDEIMFLKNNGKMELESSVRKFLATKEA